MAEIEALSLPSEGVFRSFQTLFDSVQAHRKLAGYALIVKKSERRKGKWLKVLNCKRGGKERLMVDQEYRKRKRFTFKCECPFSIKVRERGDGSWDIQHRGGAFDTHNHEPALPGTFIEHRRLTDDQTATIATHFVTNISASRSATILRTTNPDLQISNRDIYNVTAGLSRANRQGKSPPEALISRLEEEKAEGKIYFEWKQDKEGYISMLFVADMRSVEHLNQHPDILLLDCTYKTNKFDMLLLYILRVNYHGNSFTVGLCFLDQEVVETYTEAVVHLRALFRPNIWPSVIATDCESALISAISVSFPAIRTKRMLCYWHISKCILANCKAFFGTMERWDEYMAFFRRVVFSKTEDEYEDLLDEFKIEFHWNNGNLHQLPQPSASTLQEAEEVAIQELERQALEYTLGQWLVPHKTEIVHAWTDQFFHCGTNTTSRLEGAHATLKRWIGSATKDLTSVWEAIKLAIDHQIQEITIKNAQRTNSLPIGLSGQFYHQIQGKITHFRLYKFDEQFQHFRRQEQHERGGIISINCTRTFSSSIGMPCWHMIKERLDTRQGELF